ncbi:MAG: peptidase M20, partial [Rubrivivax sp.]
MNAPERLTLLEPASLQGFADERWDQAIVPALCDYIAIPAKSPMFDAQWAQQGLLEKVARDAAAWVESRKVDGLKLEIIRI